MVVVFVEHYLTDKGKNFFSEWLKDVENSLKQFKGFNRISKLKDKNNEDRTLLYLEFESYELLRNWTESIEHNSKINILKDYMVQQPKSQILEMEL